ncbi:neuropeptide receptor 15-like [Pecten maximus]|uniref:neuropeptide receptor 15-like n=1 Tax=Pecten maximus TaxID=6579 RepID=UPI00145807A3|nr:neuropeptide receptor 15-like [Pecten maximus]
MDSATTQSSTYAELNCSLGMLSGKLPIVNFTQEGYVLDCNVTMDTNSNISFAGMPPHPVHAASLEAVVGLSLLFFIIETFGIVGNSLVVIVVLLDRKMRHSVTNIFIMNLAVSDWMILVFGIPEIVQVMLNRGWVLGPVLCKFNRFILVVSLYASILSLVSVCIERFVAIVHPIKAQILCNRRKNAIAVMLVWIISIACGLPTAMYNQVIPPGYCQIVFPNHIRDIQIFKFTEFALFYFVPVCIQTALYAVIGKSLYASTDELSTKFHMRKENNCKTDRAAETIKARKGVVKMLVASVMVYIVCYAAPQVLTFYNMFADRPFHMSWSFAVFTTVVANINSAANPVLYSIFSQNFRRNFKKCLFCLCLRHRRKEYIRARFDSFESRGLSRKVSTTTKTTISRL